MAIYFILLLLIILLPMVIQKIKIKQTQAKKLILWTSFIAVFLLFALRNVSVGRDVVAYENAYKMTQQVKWNDFDYIYFEVGYILLMKICIGLGMPFQLFLAMVSLMIIAPIFLFIKQFSKNPTLSILIWICYIYFEFCLTGLRQALAMSIVLIGIKYLLSAKKYPLIKFSLLVILASLFHKGALIAFAILAILYVKKLWHAIIALLGALVVLFVFRSSLFVLMKDLFEKDSFNTSAEIYIGANIIFLVLIAIFMIFVFTLNKEENLLYQDTLLGDGKAKTKSNFNINFLLLKMYLTSIIVALFFGMETSARSYMFFNQAIIVLLPNSIEKMDKKSKTLSYILFGVFFIVFFILETLVPNNFDIVPYKFFWEG